MDVNVGLFITNNCCVTQKHASFAQIDNRQTNRQNRQTKRQTDKQSDRQTERLTDIKKES